MPMKWKQIFYTHREKKNASFICGKSYEVQKQVKNIFTCK